MHETLQRRLYIAQALLLGVPALVAGGGVAGLALYVFFDRHGYMANREGLFLLTWALAGVCGLLGWAWLSVVYLRSGRAALRSTGMLPWVGLGLGVVAALGVVALVAYNSLSGSSWRVLGYLVVGPPLLVSSAHLLWLRAVPAAVSES
ncbi:hypothetical protein [Stenotrophomonas sp. 22385]|uniref:hypothetical protein n=1 Tax=Stenotrophomonas sp. 22385 TaxID=3453915 RepID=UPI003F83C45A